MRDTEGKMMAQKFLIIPDNSVKLLEFAKRDDTVKSKRQHVGGYLIRGRPHLRSCFFEKTQLKRLLGHDLFQITRFTTQVFDLIGCGCAGDIPRQPLLPGFHEVL